MRDSTGKLARLSQFKGKAVLLTFIYTHCPDVCPLIVSSLHNALVKLGAEPKFVSPQEFSQLIASEAQRIGAIIRAANVKGE